MKAYMTHVHFQNASECANRAADARSKGLLHDEIRLSVAAHLMAAMTLEGAINEIAQKNFEERIWESIERVDTPTKWFIVFKLCFGEELDSSRGPLQTVRQLKKIRDRLAHPKELDMGEEIIVRRTDGQPLRNVSLADSVRDGDVAYLGYAKMLDHYNDKTARSAVDRTLSALRELKERSRYAGFEWLDAKESTVV